MDKTHITISKNSRFKQGNFEDYYIAKKYYGPRPIIFRSSLEFRYMVYLERHPGVEKWSSEKIVLPYYMDEKIEGKVVKKKHEYFIDFTVHWKGGEVWVVEVKPRAQCPRTKKDIQSSPTMYKNACKWKAAIAWSKLNGYVFKVITEEDIDKNKNKRI